MIDRTRRAGRHLLRLPSICSDVAVGLLQMSVDVSHDSHRDKIWLPVATTMLAADDVSAPAPLGRPLGSNTAQDRPPKVQPRSSSSRD